MVPSVLRYICSSNHSANTNPNGLSQVICGFCILSLSHSNGIALTVGAALTSSLISHLSGSPENFLRTAHFNSSASISRIFFLHKLTLNRLSVPQVSLGYLVRAHFCVVLRSALFCAPFALFLFCLFCAFSIRVKLYFNYQFSHTVITNIVPKHSSARSAIAHTYFSRYFDPPLRITI
jgi:hypothetical protein